MIQNWFGVHHGLVAAARLSPKALVPGQTAAAELSLLFLCGAAAASATGLIRLHLGIPGHAIVLAVVPMIVGLSLAPRRLGGFVMSAGAVGTAATLSLTGLASYGSGAFTSLCLTGPIMDLALARTQTGWRLYLGLVLAGVSANLVALGSRASSKLLGLDFAGMRPFDSWWLRAIVTYTLCGAVAGLIGAVCCFRWRDRESRGKVTS